MRMKLMASWNRDQAFAYSLGAVLLSAATVLGQSPTVTPILRTGDVIAGTGSMPIRSIRSIAVNDLKGVVVNVLLGDETVPVGRETPSLWIHNAGAGGNSVLQMASFPPVMPALFDCELGLASGGSVSTSRLLARHDALLPQPTAGFLDSLWIGNVPMLVEGQPAPDDDLGNPRFYGAFRKVGMIASGSSYCIADVGTSPFATNPTTGFLVEDQGSWYFWLLGGELVKRLIWKSRGVDHPAPGRSLALQELCRRAQARMQTASSRLRPALCQYALNARMLPGVAPARSV